MKKLGEYYVLTFTFVYVAGKKTDDFKEGERFITIPQGYMSLQDGAIISYGVAEKVGRQYKKPMFKKV